VPYDADKLKRMDREAVQLYLLRFIHDRYQRHNDNLLATFCSLVRRYSDEVDAATKEAIYRFKLQASDDVEQGAKILALFLDPSIDGQTPFSAVRDRAHALLKPERLDQLCRHLAADGSLDEASFEWKEVDGVMAKLKRNLRRLLRFLALQGTPAHAALLETLLDERFESVNRRILAGENAFVRVQDGRTAWERAVRSEEPLPSCCLSDYFTGNSPNYFTAR
jgi:hypothetical protein